MSLVWIIYLIGVLSGKGVTILFGAVPVLISMVYGIYYIVLNLENSERYEPKPLPKIHKKVFILSFLSCLFLALLPSKETAYTMLAAYGVEQAAENPDVKRMAGKSLEVIEKAMDEYLDKGDSK